MPNYHNITHIPTGDYLTKAQVATERGVIHQTVQKWIERGWLPAIHLPGLGYIINVANLEGFNPPKPGPKSSAS